MLYVRKNDGSTYGPIEIDRLKRWVEDGRVAPDDELSEDQEHWSPADEQSELGMDWLLDLASGKTAGPLHLMAVAESAGAGTLPLDTPVRLKQGGEPQTLAQALVPLLVRRMAALDRERATLAQALHEAKQEAERLKEVKPSPTEPEAPDPEADEEREALKHQLQEERDRHEATQAEHEAREKELAERVHELEEQLANKVATETSSAPIADDESLMASYKELAANHDQLITELQTKTSDLSVAHERLAELEQGEEERFKHAEAQAQREHAEADKARARVDELEEKHYILVKSYRELHDRFINLRQQVPAAPVDEPDAPAAN